MGNFIAYPTWKGVHGTDWVEVVIHPLAERKAFALITKLPDSARMILRQAGAAHLWREKRAGQATPSLALQTLTNRIKIIFLLSKQVAYPVHQRQAL
jgi:hypothetical protein